MKMKREPSHMKMMRRGEVAEASEAVVAVAVVDDDDDDAVAGDYDDDGTDDAFDSAALASATF